MKKLLFIFTACLALFTSCNDGSTPTDKKIAGNWVADRIEESFLENGAYQTEVEYVYTYFEAYPDNTFSWGSEGDRTSGSWVLNGNTLILSFNGAGDDYQKFIVQKSTSAELVLRMEFDNGYADYPFKKH